MGFINTISSLNEVPQFEVEKVPVFGRDQVPIPDTFSLQRTDTRQHLGIVGKKYRPIQMEEMVDVLDKASCQIGDIDHVGYTSSRNGRKVLIQSKLAANIDVDGDKIEPYFYTVIDNTGMGSNKTIPSTTRIACDNALHLISGDADSTSRHSFSFDMKVEKMLQSIVGSIKAAKNFNSTMVELKNSAFTRDEMVKFTKKLVPVLEDESSRRISKREKLVELFEKGRGNVGETKWDALNAITEYETHTGKKTPEKLIRNLVNTSMSGKALALLA